MRQSLIPLLETRPVRLAFELEARFGVLCTSALAYTGQVNTRMYEQL